MPPRSDGSPEAPVPSLDRDRDRREPPVAAAFSEAPPLETEAEAVEYRTGAAPSEVPSSSPHPRAGVPIEYRAPPPAVGHEAHRPSAPVTGQRGPVPVTHADSALPFEPVQVSAREPAACAPVDARAATPAWPTLPAPALRAGSEDRPDRGAEERRRARLEREQRGWPWNG
ncbi:MAG: hypothetical protein ACYTGZ_10780 [Planctomycetota bacterium]